LGWKVQGSRNETQEGPGPPLGGGGGVVSFTGGVPGSEEDPDLREGWGGVSAEEEKS